MDPQAAWDQLLAAYVAGDWTEIEEHATTLLAWLDRGGFPPMIIQQPDLDSDWNRALVAGETVQEIDDVVERQHAAIFLDHPFFQPSDPVHWLRRILENRDLRAALHLN